MLSPHLRAEVSPRLPLRPDFREDLPAENVDVSPFCPSSQKHNASLNIKYKMSISQTKRIEARVILERAAHLPVYGCNRGLTYPDWDRVFHRDQHPEVPSKWAIAGVITPHFVHVSTTNCLRAQTSQTGSIGRASAAIRPVT